MFSHRQSQRLFERFFLGKGGLAPEASSLVRLLGPFPRHFGPVLQREKMMVAAGQVGAQDQGEFADRASGGEGADFAAAAGAEVSALSRAGMAGAERRGEIDDARGESHHQEGGLNRRAVGFGAIIVRCRRSGRGGGAHQEFAEMDFVQSHGVALGWRQGGIGARDERDEEGDLSCQANHGAGDVCGDKSADGGVDIAGVGG